MTGEDDDILGRHDRDGVAWLTMNRPQARNALSAKLMAALDGALVEAAADRSVRAIVIGANGPAFCAGHDLREVRGLRHDAAAMRALFDQCSALMQRIVWLEKPVIARVHGIATAAGCQLVATCDLAIAAEGSRFATPGVGIGLFCSTPMVALSRAVGRKAALAMLLTGDMIDADRARAIGLVNDVVPEAALDDAVQALAMRIARGSPAAMAFGKRAFQTQIDLPLADAYAAMAEVMAANMADADADEGIGAFLARRPPVWTAG